jgi:hypothetical protein
VDREGRGERPGGWRMLVGSGPRKGVVLAYGASISLDKGVLGRLGWLSEVPPLQRPLSSERWKGR